jgi:2-oxoglutarate ferredoxin oxidoreductase subunit alpha
MHDMTIDAFRLADQYRTPVIVLADGRLGQMMEPITLYTGAPPPVPAKPWALTGAKGREPRYIRSLFLLEGGLEQHNKTLQEEYRQIVRVETRSEEIMTEDCDYAIAAWGTCARIAKEAIKQTRSMGIKAGLFRPVTLWPFPTPALAALAGRVKAMLVVEMNAGQMIEDVQLAVSGRTAVHFSGYPGGRVPTVSNILAALKKVINQ